MRTNGSTLVIDVPAEFSGKAIELVSQKKGRYVSNGAKRRFTTFRV